MASRTPPAIILGTHTLGDVTKDPGLVHFDQPEDVEKLLTAWADRGYNQIDTARNYPTNDNGGSERRLGRAGAVDRFVVHTKIQGVGQPGSLSADKVQKSISDSLHDLKARSVETMFIHVPDRHTPFEDTARAINEAFKQGKFKKFGLSNYSASEVQEFLEVCERNGFVMPSVYQGHYNALVRGGEGELFPVLRKHGMSFMGYSAAAGGIFSNTASTTGRWVNGSAIGDTYNALYGSPKVSESVKRVQDLAGKHNISGHAAALRWVRFHSILDGSRGDAVLFAVSTIKQLNQSVDALESGPLPEDLAMALSAVYDSLDGCGPPYYVGESVLKASGQ